MAEWSKAPDSKVDALSKPFSALAQCVPANNSLSRNFVAPAGEGIAGKKMGFSVARKSELFPGRKVVHQLAKMASICAVFVPPQRAAGASC
jgi:hypothetical protein